MVAPKGKPKVWNDTNKQSAINIILSEIPKGNSVRSILDDADRKILPSWVTFSKWLKEDEELVKQYTRACEARHDKIFDEILEIADKQDKDIKIVDGVEVVDHNAINRNRLQIDARKWALSKMNPKKYGDKLDVTSDGDSIQQPVISKIVIKE